MQMMPCLALARSPSSRMLFWKYLAMRVANGVGGSWPYCQGGIAKLSPGECKFFASSNAGLKQAPARATHERTHAQAAATNEGPPTPEALTMPRSAGTTG